MDCAEVRTRLSALADGETPRDEAARLEGHARRCPECANRIALAKKEARLLRAALAGPRPARAPHLPPRAAWAAAVILALAVGAAAGLGPLYRAVTERRSAASSEQVRVSLDAPVLVRSDGVPMRAFLAELTDRSGTPVRLADGALAGLDREPRVRILLETPIRLRSVLGLLEDFYGLRPVITGEGVVLE